MPPMRRGVFVCLAAWVTVLAERGGPSIGVGASRSGRGNACSSDSSSDNRKTIGTCS